MMMDIFSSFDPGINSLFNWSPFFFLFSNFLVLCLVSGVMWSSPSRVHFMMFYILGVMVEQVNRTNMKSLKGLSLLMASLFFLIIMMNLFGAVPYIFSMTAHLLFTMVVGLPLWLSLIVSSIFFSPTYTAASLLPGGAPFWLNPFLILIETVSILVRPITLSVRLAANMSAGHIVLGLLGIYLSYSMFNFSLTSTLLLMLIQVGYFMFEFGICMIQSYIFCLLLSLYSDDHSH